MLHFKLEPALLPPLSVAVNEAAPVSDAVEPTSAGGDSGFADQRPVPMQRQQEQSILSELLGRGYTPGCLPKNAPGRPGVKAQIRAALANRPGWVGTVFDKAWERLRRGGEIADE